MVIKSTFQNGKCKKIDILYWMKKSTKRIFLQRICDNYMAFNPKDNRYFFDKGNISMRNFYSGNRAA